MTEKAYRIETNIEDDSVLIIVDDRVVLYLTFEELLAFMADLAMVGDVLNA